MQIKYSCLPQSVHANFDYGIFTRWLMIWLGKFYVYLIAIKISELKITIFLVEFLITLFENEVHSDTIMILRWEFVLQRVENVGFHCRYGYYYHHKDYYNVGHQLQNWTNKKTFKITSRIHWTSTKDRPLVIACLPICRHSRKSINCFILFFKYTDKISNASLFLFNR